MKTTKRVLSGLAAAAFACTAAYAGFTQPAPVMVDMVNMTAQGDMITARNDKDDDVFIGCGMRLVEGASGDVFELGFCQAEDDEGDNVTCFTQNRDLLEALRAQNDSSFITFRWSDDGTGNLTCTRIGFSTQSFYLEKGK